MAGFSSPAKLFSSFGLVIWIGIIWASIAFFSTLLLVEGEMLWWRDRAIYFMTGVAGLGASWLCLRNWLLPKIISDRRLWLCLGLGSIAQIIVSFISIFGDSIRQDNLDASIIYLFRFISYIFLVLGILLAIGLRSLSISAIQLSLLAGLTMLLLGLALLISMIGKNAKILTSSVSFLTVDKFLNFFYILADITILILSLTLLLTYLGGNFARTWMAIAFACSCFYLADLWHIYTANFINAEPTSILDSAWTFGAIAVGVGAAWEYQLSIVPPRNRYTEIDRTAISPTQFSSEILDDRSVSIDKNSIFSFNFSKIVWAGIIWASLSFFYLVLASVLKLDLELPIWLVWLKYFFAGVAFLVASWLCLRNWKLSKIISDRRIWLFLGLGSIAKGIAEPFAVFWEISWQQNSDNSLAHIFYIVSSLLLIAGMVIAVKSKGISISAWQSGILSFATAFSIGLAFAIGFPQKNIETNIAATLAEMGSAPAWVLSIERLLYPFIGFLHFAYVIADISILILATALLLTYWRGKFFQTWLLIGCACLCLYLNDLWTFVSADFPLKDILDFLTILAGVFLGIGAAWEYQISQTPPRSPILNK
jgi:hypothetical protein